MIPLSRRGFIFGAAATLAVIRTPGLIMPVKGFGGGQVALNAIRIGDPVVRGQIYTSSEFAKALWPGIRGWYAVAYADRAPQWQEVFNDQRIAFAT